MSVGLATRENGIAADFSREQIDLIKQTVARDTTDAQLKLLLYTASARGLDPLLRQIHGIVRDGQMAIQVGIDGLRLIADRTGTYAGNDEPHFYQAADATYPERAAVTVWKLVQGQRCGFTASARWSEFYPGEGKAGFMWRKMPHVMLGKVAESMALRKAFPHETSGLYIHEEMEQADTSAPRISPPTAPVAAPDDDDRLDAIEAEYREAQPKAAASAGKKATAEQWGRWTKATALANELGIAYKELPNDPDALLAQRWTERLEGLVKQEQEARGAASAAFAAPAEPEWTPDDEPF